MYACQSSRYARRQCVLDLAPRRGEISLPRLVDAVSGHRQRAIELKMSDLPPGVCGQWRQYADRDVFLIQKGLPAWDSTLAHELGHLVLGHEGIPVVQAARAGDGIRQLRPDRIHAQPTHRLHGTER